MTYIPRNAESRLKHFAIGYPVIVITGPRQSGKSTLVRHAFPEHHYVSLEDLDQREFAETDPRGFLNQFSGRAILDEAQRCPALFSYLQTRVDEQQQPGEFILTESQQFGLLSGITQSLAGRAALLTLLPMTYGELQRSGKIGENLDKILFDGAYPPIFDRGLEPRPWYGNYVRTYLERDVRQLIKVRVLRTTQPKPGYLFWKPVTSSICCHRIIRISTSVWSKHPNSIFWIPVLRVGCSVSRTANNWPPTCNGAPCSKPGSSVNCSKPVTTRGKRQTFTSGVIVRDTRWIC